MKVLSFERDSLKRFLKLFYHHSHSPAPIGEAPIDFDFGQICLELFEYESDFSVYAAPGSHTVSKPGTSQ